jgi:hypothetical protein
MWDVEYTDEFGEWWDSLSEDEQDRISATVDILVEEGPELRFPYCSGVKSSRHPHMRELRITYHGMPIRVFYAFDPRRCAILLIGGNKTGDDRWYDKFVPIADDLYDQHIRELRSRGEIP